MINSNETSVKLAPFKRLLPSGIKRAGKKALLKQTFRQAMLKISELREGELPGRDLLHQLQTGWGNEGFAARYDYLEEVIKQAATTSGPILECGSGLTTILLGLFAGRRGVQVCSLEHTSEWRERVVGVLERYAIPNVQVCLSPLVDHGGFSWYEPPQLPDQFSMVVCDGPPGSTSGGRYGLMPVMMTRLSNGTVILLDDADRTGEAEVLHRWTLEQRVNVVLREAPTGAFALVTCNRN